MLLIPYIMSILGKSWNILHERQKGDTLWASLLKARNIENPGEFFSSASLSDLHDPFLFDDMQKSVDRINSAINARERIWIYGDYDVDGTSGASLLVHALRFLGAEVSYRVPHRLNEGYGLHDSYVEEAAKNNIKILITVDCGISCKKQIDRAEELGVNVIVTDHHTIPKELPNAFAILHPQTSNYPFKFLSGSGVAFKLASALLKDEDMIMALTDLASLGTVADCVPLIGENRVIVKLGLAQMPKTKWDGLRALVSEVKTFTSETIGFQIGPRINAAGRMDNPLWAIQTLLASGDDAFKKSQKLEELNRERQLLSGNIYKEALSKINPSDAIIIAEGQGWSSGIVGLIAGKIQEKHSKPTLILDDRGDFLIGSARSVPGFNVVEAIKQASHLLETFGGHEQAAGFHLKKDKYEEFKKILREYSKEYFAKNPHRPIVNIDTYLTDKDLHIDNCETIQKFAPFGIANEEPKLILENARVINVKKIGREAEHLRFTAISGVEMVNGVAFRMAAHEEKLANATKLVANLQKNTWEGRDSLQLNLVDFS
jgi:single-stranded-DNA-specific exonuclease